MFALRHALEPRFRHVLIFCVQLALIGFAVHAHTGTGAWLAMLLLIALCLAAWLYALGTLRVLTDTPLSRIDSAAQGFVAIEGRGKALAGLPLYSPFHGLPVLWYRIETEERSSDGDWRSKGVEESDDSFMLEDDSGSCVVYPESAAVHTTRRETRSDGDMRYTHWCLIARDELTVYGDFQSMQGDGLSRTEREAVKEILADWKADPAELRRRFDLNGDGEFSEEEWDLVRAAAQREARQQRIDADKIADTHILRAPNNGRPFVISAVKPWRLKLPLRAWCVWHAGLFLLACWALAVLHRTGWLALS